MKHKVTSGIVEVKRSKAVGQRTLGEAECVASFLRRRESLKPRSA